MSEPKKSRAPRPNLTAREARFCALYAESGNATRAYLAAGFPCPNTNAAGVQAFKLLRKGKIRDLIRRMQGEALDAAQVTTDRIAQGLARIAFADRADLFDDRGRLLPPRAWPADVAGTVEGVESEDLFEAVADPNGPKRRELVGYARKVKTARRTEALKVLAQWRRMIGPDVPPLDVLLGALPPDLATVVREALAKAVLANGEGISPTVLPPPGGVGGEARMDAV
ncbi:terminase small subunit [Gemmata sp. JC673]|uniref:Terminase small subunit n=1 Tax=Gemmata algarum TaxID=2975278 RepID=A0ABU5ETH8_9BACT|nr:terminase small subunit [Gemmata algarum]MDY3558391.1 terminase small subunit [Gemmata algarum]